MTGHDDIEEAVSPDGEPQRYTDTMNGSEGDMEGVEGRVLA